ncbi:DUF6046 domain-containing protein [Hymenobacter sp. 15J16-1T3B]|uniref:DUF6046 domain-containing protein n=1 Tax=Hymenobacter sp. 15J16-1T3B TaxID=2886941 RepID=UPI001D111078|nr:DUF6046 domain-containing protein [Hymenobacter sp. 15J16-1T3B]MCC3159522.1 DUF6046 domain-containing protein [Hymenobacter sp. 15J16-1T3B]
MQYNINLKALAVEAFGYAPLMRYQVPPKPEPAADPYSAFGTPLAPNKDGTGLLGLPMFQRVLLGPVGGEVLLQEPIVTIDRPKLIVTTEIQGRDGSVKEYISDGDFQLTIKGILAPPISNGQYARRYPEAEVQALKRVLDLPEALPIACRLCGLHGIHNVVVKHRSWPPLPGFTNLQAYEIQLVSDNAPELLI